MNSLPFSSDHRYHDRCLDELYETVIPSVISTVSGLFLPILHFSGNSFRHFERENGDVRRIAILECKVFLFFFLSENTGFIGMLSASLDSVIACMRWEESSSKAVSSLAVSIT